MGKSRAALDKAIPGVLEKLAGRLPGMLIESLREQWNDLDKLDRQIADIERRLQTWLKDDQACKAIASNNPLQDDTLKGCGGNRMR
ncbi:hypothetical protein D8I24_0180 (plasmid) [Cupriavidus necator H850]|nr:hypothetical protein D8I24_0180 [Cupriavidus necator H850]